MREEEKMTFIEAMQALGEWLCSLPEKTIDLYTKPKPGEDWAFLMLFTVLLGSCLIGFILTFVFYIK